MKGSKSSFRRTINGFPTFNVISRAKFYETCTGEKIAGSRTYLRIWYTKQIEKTHIREQ